MDIHDDDQDRLIDMLLREELGGQRPPQLADRILERVRRERWNIFRRVRPLWLGIGAAVAVAAIAFLVVPMFFSDNKNPTTPVVKNETPPPTPPTPTPPVPAPQPKPPEVAEKVFKTDKEEKTVTFGGFCKVTLTPNTSIEDIHGNGDAQKIRLDQGSVLCDIEPNKGRFSVENPLGNVIVKGTAFRVSVNAEKRDEKISRSRLSVKVTRGSVILDTKSWGEILLTEGHEGGSLVGTVTKNEREWIEVKVDGEREPHRFMPRWLADRGGLDRKMVERLAQIPANSHVRLLWVSDEHDRIVGIEKIDGPPAPPPAQPQHHEVEHKDGEHRDRPPERRDGDRKEGDRK